jgi:hypothetical protein
LNSYRFRHLTPRYWKLRKEFGKEAKITRQGESWGIMLPSQVSVPVATPGAHGPKFSVAFVATGPVNTAGNTAVLVTQPAMLGGNIRGDVFVERVEPREGGRGSWYYGADSGEPDSYRKVAEENQKLLGEFDGAAEEAHVSEPFGDVDWLWSDSLPDSSGRPLWSEGIARLMAARMSGFSEPTDKLKSPVGEADIEISPEPYATWPR